MSFNIRDYKLPSGSLIRFGNPNQKDGNGNPYLTYTYSSAGIHYDEIGLVIEHSKPIYLKVLVNERIVKLDLGDLANMVGYVFDITLVSLPNGSRNPMNCSKWYSK